MKILPSIILSASLCTGLAGCGDAWKTKNQIMANCKMDALKAHPRVEDGILDTSVFKEYTSECMISNGYEFNFSNENCFTFLTLETQESCYVKSRPFSSVPSFLGWLEPRRSKVEAASPAPTAK